MIVKRDDGWYVVSKKGKNLGGPYSNRDGALKRLRQVEYFKHAEFDKAQFVYDELCKVAAYGADLGDYWDYFKNVAQHKKEVYDYGKDLGISKWTLLKHDIDKFFPKRFMRYAEWYYGPEGISGTKNPELRAKKREQSAIHKQRSAHHSYLFGKRPDTEHQLETLVDWYSAMRRAKNFPKDGISLKDWASNIVEKDKKKRFSEETKNYIKKKLREL